ncbi:hypothetical protein SPLC1_S542650 [Arthrospira platensis C1]|nr:hypothetical protein SPLC1_S542650 [Arthrospira platensis C1]
MRKTGSPNAQPNNFKLIPNQANFWQIVNPKPHRDL